MCDYCERPRLWQRSMMLKRRDFLPYEIKTGPWLSLLAATLASRDDKGSDLFLEWNIKAKPVQSRLPLTPDWPCEESLQTEELFALSTVGLTPTSACEIFPLWHMNANLQKDKPECCAAPAAHRRLSGWGTWNVPIHALRTFRKV